ncbi:MAG TPA: hypothetical protein VHD31_01440 [Candidatus Paceibacterota bacterium]|nr:hypothetical protein [Candidatus Paceibacterota bacterium]
MAADGTIPVLAFAPTGLAEIDQLIGKLRNEDNWLQYRARDFWNPNLACAEQTMRNLGVMYLGPAILATANEGRPLRYDSIPSFNDAKETTHSHLMQVLRRTRENIISGKTTVYIPTAEELRLARRQKMRKFWKSIGNACFNALTFLHRDLIDGNI